MLFIPENALETALVRAVKEPATAPHFYRLPLASDCWCWARSKARRATGLQPPRRPDGNWAPG
jgi:hypothetical protein